MFWDNYYKLCASENKTPNKVAAELGIASGTVSGWKKGALPRPQVMQKLCNHFGVTKEQLISDLTDTEDIHTSFSAETEASISPEIAETIELARRLAETEAGRAKLRDVTEWIRRAVELEDVENRLKNK